MGKEWASLKVEPTLHRNTTIKGHAACTAVHGAIPGQRAGSGGGKFKAERQKRGLTLRNDDCSLLIQVLLIYGWRGEKGIP